MKHDFLHPATQQAYYDTEQCNGLLRIWARSPFLVMDTSTAPLPAAARAAIQRGLAEGKKLSMGPTDLALLHCLPHDDPACVALVPRLAEHWWGQRPAPQAAPQPASTSEAEAGAAAPAANGGGVDMTEERCAGCDKRKGDPGVPKLRSCTGCRTVKYCSTDCQHAHWAAHKAACKEAKRRLSQLVHAGQQQQQSQADV